MPDPQSFTLTTTPSLSAAHLGKAGEGHRRSFKARFVRAGRIRGPANKPANVIIEPAALQSAVAKGLFDGRAVFVDHAGWFDHPSVKNLAGVTLSSQWNDADQAVEGTISFYDSIPQIPHLLDQLLGDHQPPDIGLSIVFYPRWAPRDNDSEPRRIIEILHVDPLTSFSSLPPTAASCKPYPLFINP